MGGILFNERNGHWSGDAIEYTGLHDWLNRVFGKASKCENPNCFYPRKNAARSWVREPKRFEWAKVRGVPYERKRENFIMMCPSCHRKYDMNLINL